MTTDMTRLVQELPNGVIAVGTASGVDFIKSDNVITVNEALKTDAFVAPNA